MIIRNCFTLLNDLCELEQQISKLENEIRKNYPEIDIEKVLQKSLDKKMSKS